MTHRMTHDLKEKRGKYWIFGSVDMLAVYKGGGVVCWRNVLIIFPSDYQLCRCLGLFRRLGAGRGSRVACVCRVCDRAFFQFAIGCVTSRPTRYMSAILKASRHSNARRLFLSFSNLSLIPRPCFTTRAYFPSWNRKSLESPHHPTY